MRQQSNEQPPLSIGIIVAISSAVVLGILLGTTVLQCSASQSAPSQNTPPSVSVFLPANVPSESVQIAYYMVGPFGGYGGYTEQKPGLDSCEIASSVNEKAATGIKLVVYATDCEIQRFVLPLTNDSQIKQQFDCRPTPKINLEGHIMPGRLVRDTNTRLIVTYEAFWADRFFNIADGPVTAFRLASVRPGADGTFQVDLPHFAVDDEPSSSSPKAGLSLSLIDSDTGNPIAFNLEPALPEFMTEVHTLRIESYYPKNLEFIETPPQQQTQ